MDVDISDILASVSRPHHNSHHHQHQHTPADTSVHTDHQLLVRAWTSDRCSPSLLPYPTALVTRTLSRVATQIQRIEDLTSSVPDSTNNNSGDDGSAGRLNGYGYGSDSLASSKNLNLILSILQTDLGRTQFLVRSFLRQRLGKIARHAVYYLQLLDNEQQSSDAARGSETQQQQQQGKLMSDEESRFLRRHHVLLSQFYAAAFLDGLPPRMRRLDDSSGGLGNNMVDAPDWGAAVVVRCLDEAWDNTGDVGRGGEEGASVELRMRRGEVWVVRWGDVRNGVGGGGLELL